MAKIDDLTILLKAKDQTSGAFKSLNKRFGKLSGLTRIAVRGMAAFGAAVGAAFSAAVANGATLNDELTRMKNSIGTTAKEADELYKIIREGAPTTNMEQLGEGLLTLKEGFFDARAESGPLFDLVRDFGADIDLGVESPREQLLEFLKAMREIPSATVRAGAAVANFGGEDAKSIITITNDVVLLDQTIERLSGTVRDLPSFITDAQIQRTQEAKDASVSLNNAWDDLSSNLYDLVSPALKRTSERMETFVKWADKATNKARDFLASFGGDFAPVGITAESTLEGINNQMRIITRSIDQNASELATLPKYGISWRREELQRENRLYERQIEYLKDVRALTGPSGSDDGDGSSVSGSGLGGGSGSQVNQAQKLFETQQKAITGLADNMLLGLGELDLGQAIDKKLGLNALQDKEYLRIMGLDLDDGRKLQLALLLSSQFEGVLEETQKQINQKQGLLGIVKSMDSIVDGLAANDTDATEAEAERQKALQEQMSLSAAKAQNLQSIMSSAASAVGTLGAAFAKTKNQARAYVAIQEILATVAAYSAATQALSDPSSLTPFQKFAAYSAVLARGLAGVAAVRSAGSSLGGGGGSSASTTASTAGTRIAQAPAQQDQQQNRQLVNITIQGSTDGKVDIEALDEALRQLGKVPGSTQYRLRQVAA